MLNNHEDRQARKVHHAHLHSYQLDRYSLTLRNTDHRESTKDTHIESHRAKKMYKVKGK